MRKVLALFVALVVAALSVLPASPLYSGGSAYAAGQTYTADVTRAMDYTKAFAVLTIVNSERAKEGLAPLKMSVDLLDVAKVRVVETTIYFSHTRPDGRDTWTASDSVSGLGMMGENIAYGYWTAANVMDGWMNSPGHRANILRENYTEIGIGCVASPDGAFYWVQYFGDRPSPAEASKPGNAQETFRISANADYVAMVTFDSRGGSAVFAKFVARYPVGSAVAYGDLPATKRAGYAFEGWYTAPSGGSKVKASTKLTGNATVYARWSVDPPAANKIKKLKKGKKSFTVKWTSAPGAAKYQIGYKLKTAKQWKVKTYASSKRSAVVKNLKKNKTYQVRVRSYKVVEGKNYPSKWSKAKTVKPR